MYNGGTTVGSEQTYSTTASDYETLWTWHIWVTDEVYKNNGTVSKNDGITVTGDIPIDQTYPSYNTTTSSKIARLTTDAGVKIADIMPVNLGWVPDADTWNVYEPREVWVEVQQVDANNAGGHNTIHLKIRQEARPELVKGTSTIYQWGSPIAHPMSTPPTGSDMTWGRWGGGSANTAYWATSGKTLYDPCPPGFQLPAGNIFTGFSLTGENITSTSSGANLNIWANSGSEKSADLNWGAYVYTKAHSGSIADADRYGPMVYIPASGYWSSRSDSNFESTAFFWTGGYSGSNGVNVRLRPQKGSTSSGTFDYFRYDESNMLFDYAMPVRPVVSTP